VNRVIAPYITMWSAEQDLLCRLVERSGLGIGYADELPADRDAQGVLWRQTAAHHGLGRPEFGKVHPLRQRQAMERLLCQVCGVPAVCRDVSAAVPGVAARRRRDSGP